MGNLIEMRKELDIILDTAIPNERQRKAVNRLVDDLFVKYF